MTRDEKLALLRAWIDRHDALNEHWESLCRLTGATTDSHLGEAVWAAFSGYTEALELALGDPFDSLKWHWLENQMGDRGHVAGIEGDMREINTVEDLLWLIEVTA